MVQARARVVPGDETDARHGRVPEADLRPLQERAARQEREIESLCREVLERYEEATFVYRLSDRIGEVLGESAIARLVLSDVVAVLGATAGEVWLKAGDAIVLAAAAPGTGPRAPDPATVETIASGRPWVLDDACGVSAAVAVPLPDGPGAWLGAIVLHGRPPGRSYRAGEIKLLSAVAALTAAFVRNDRLSEKARLSDLRRREDEIARQVHRGLLPRHDPLFAGVDVSGGFRAADLVGGDYYGYVAMADGSLGIAMADVSGHGVGAALFMATAKGALESEAREVLSPAAVLARVNEVLASDFSAADMFATLFFVRIRPDGRRLEWANAGHNPPLLLRAAGGIEVLPPCGPALGIVSGATWTDATRPFGVGDVLLLYTDGVVEARDSGRRPFGVERLAAAARRAAADAIGIRENVLAELALHTGPVVAHDDRTLVVVRGVALPEGS